MTARARSRQERRESNALQPHFLLEQVRDALLGIQFLHCDTLEHELPRFSRRLTISARWMNVSNGSRRRGSDGRLVDDGDRSRSDEGREGEERGEEGGAHVGRG